MDPLRWELIRTRFDELVELPAPERERRLRALHDEDPELSSAVDSLLVADSSPGDELAGLDATLLPAAPSPSVEPAETAPPLPDPLELTGKTVSHYRILGPLGAGGMGFVYRAEDARLHRQVALKFLLPQLSPDAAARERFLQEARAAGSLDHPNLCTIHEVDEADAGRLFLAMPLYPGETLKERLARQGRLGIDEALEIARQVAQGLLCAHQAGIVHRDLKPGNVMLLPDGMVKILDFGLARALDASHTGEGVVGTLAYMAPEQILDQTVDARADLWALGVVLYQMLTGERPFRSYSDQELVAAVLREKPQPPTKLRPEVPPPVDELTLRLLQKKPGRRPPSSAEVLTELQRLIAGRREDSEGTSGWKRDALLLLPSRALRRPLQLAAAVVFVLALVLGGWMVGRTVVPPSGELPSIAVLPLENLGGSLEESLARGLQLELISSLGSASRLQVISSQSVREFAGSTAPASEIGSTLGADYILTGSTLRSGSQIRVALQLTEASSNRNLWSEGFVTADTADLFALQTRLAQEVANALRVRLTTDEHMRLSRLPTSDPKAYNLYVRGQEYEARGTSRDQRIASTLYGEAVALDPEFALAYARKSVVDGRIFRRGESMDRWNPDQAERSRRAAATAIALSPGLPQAHLAVGYYLYHVHSDYAGALKSFQVALRELPNDADAHEALADAYRRLGRWDDALDALRRAVELDPRNPERHRHLADTYRQLRRFPAAVEAIERAIELAPDHYGYRETRARIMISWLGAPDSLAVVLQRAPADWYTTAAAISPRLDLAMLQRRPQDALAAIVNLTPELMEARLAEGSTDLHQLRARAYAFVGDSARARADHQVVREALEASLRQRADDPHTYADLGLAYAGLGLRAQAVRASREAMRRLPMEEDAWEGDTYVAHAAEAYAQIGELDAAIDLLQRLLASPTLITPQMLRLEPRWDPLRHSPRFQALLRSR